jgi:hypothetical protein
MTNQCVMTEGGTRAAERADRGSVTCSNLIRQQVLELFLIDWVLHIAAGRRPALRYVLSSVFQRIPAYSNIFQPIPEFKNFPGKKQQMNAHADQSSESKFTPDPDPLPFEGRGVGGPETAQHRRKWIYVDLPGLCGQRRDLQNHLKPLKSM